MRNIITTTKRPSPLGARLISSATLSVRGSGHPRFDDRCARQTNIEDRLYIFQELRAEGHHERTSEANEEEG